MIRYGIAGFGIHAAKRLMPGFADAERSCAVAFSRRNLAQAQADGAQFGIAPYATTRELCQSAEVDAVFVTSPNALHLSDVLTAIEHGKHVLCEKPMALNAAEVEQMIEAAGKRGVLLGVAQCFRFGDAVLRIREAVQRQELGRAVAIRVDFTFTGLGDQPRWLHEAGPIDDVGVHCLDAMRFILTDEPVSCLVMTEHDELSGKVECSAAFSLRFSQGALGSSFVSMRAPYRTAIEVTAAEGSIVAQDGLNVDWPVTIEFRGASGVRTETVSSATAYTRQFDAFSAAIESGSKFAATAEDGLQNQRILDALHRSASLRQEVTLDLRGQDVEQAKASPPAGRP